MRGQGVGGMKEREGEREWESEEEGGRSVVKISKINVYTFIQLTILYTKLETKLFGSCCLSRMDTILEKGIPIDMA